MSISKNTSFPADHSCLPVVRWLGSHAWLLRKIHYGIHIQAEIELKTSAFSPLCGGFGSGNHCASPPCCWGATFITAFCFRHWKSWVWPGVPVSRNSGWYPCGQFNLFLELESLEKTPEPHTSHTFTRFLHHFSLMPLLDIFEKAVLVLFDKWKKYKIGWQACLTGIPWYCGCSICFRGNNGFVLKQFAF